MAKQTDEILNKIDTLNAFDNEYELLAEAGDLDDRVGPHTDKAVQIDGNFLPYSQMRCDMDGALYLASWLYAKYY